MDHLIRRISLSKSAIEIEKLITEARNMGALSRPVIESAVHKLMQDDDTKNVPLCHQLVRGFKPEIMKKFDHVCLDQVFSCLCECKDFSNALQVFPLLGRRPSDSSIHQYISLLKDTVQSSREFAPSAHSELTGIWQKAISIKGEDVKLLLALFEALSYSKSAQRDLIIQVIQRAPHKSFNCAAMLCFMDFCAAERLEQLARDVWIWGKSVRAGELGSFDLFMVTIRYCGLVHAPVDDLWKLWSEIKECGLDEDPNLVLAMFKALSSEGSKEARESFISLVISKPLLATPETLSIYGIFLQYSDRANNVELANQIWNWGEPIRQQGKITHELYAIRFRHLKLASAPAAEFHALWKEVQQNSHGETLELINSMLSSISLQEQKQFISDFITNVPCTVLLCKLVLHFLEPCRETKDKELTKRVWSWSAPIMKVELGSHKFFSSCFLYLCKAADNNEEELHNFLGLIMECSVGENADLVTSILREFKNEPGVRKQFISLIISNAPNATFNMSHLGACIKHCSETNDKELAHKVWDWGESIREKESATPDFFIVSQRYLHLIGAPAEEVQALWNQATELGLNESPEFIISKCQFLSINLKEQEKYISEIISKPPAKSTFPIEVLECFLAQQCVQKNLPLAQSIWSWGLEIRERERGTDLLASITLGYLQICGWSGDMDLLESVWNEADEFGVGKRKQILKFYMDALVSRIEA